MSKPRVRIKEYPQYEYTRWYVEAWEGLLGWQPVKGFQTQEEATAFAQEYKEHLKHPQEYEIS